MWSGDCWASHLELYVPLLPQTAASSPIHAEGWVTNDICLGADLQQQGKWEGPQSSVQKLQEDNSSLCFHSQKNSWESHSYVCLWFLLELVIYSALSAHLSYFLFFCCFPGVSLLLLLHWRLLSITCSGQQMSQQHISALPQLVTEQKNSVGEGEDCT